MKRSLGFLSFRFTCSSQENSIIDVAGHFWTLMRCLNEEKRLVVSDVRRQGPQYMYGVARMA